MKKILLLVLLMGLSVTGYAKQVVPDGEGNIYIVDGRSVYFCQISQYLSGCTLIDSDYKKE